MKLAQSEKYKDDDWWEWAVWIDGKPEELKSISAVTYTLHPTFSNPIRTVTNRRSKFKLRSEGWGGFVVYARVSLKDGGVRQIKRELKLHYPDGTRTTA
jgi:transcription initiation factor IIF auxiliary subunit